MFSSILTALSATPAYFFPYFSYKVQFPLVLIIIIVSLLPLQVVLELEKKLFNYVNLDLFRENNGTSVSHSIVSIFFSLSFQHFCSFSRNVSFFFFLRTSFCRLLFSNNVLLLHFRYNLTDYQNKWICIACIGLSQSMHGLPWRANCLEKTHL